MYSTEACLYSTIKSVSTEVCLYWRLSVLKTVCTEVCLYSTEACLHLIMSLIKSVCYEFGWTKVCLDWGLSVLQSFCTEVWLYTEAWPFWDVAALKSVCRLSNFVYWRLALIGQCQEMFYLFFVYVIFILALCAQSKIVLHTFLFSRRYCTYLLAK